METWSTYVFWVWTARFRICMSSIMRCRSDVMETTPLRNGLCCKQPLHGFAREPAWEGAGLIGVGEQQVGPGVLTDLRATHTAWRVIGVVGRLNSFEVKVLPQPDGW